MWSAIEKKSSDKVAIKKIANCFGRNTEAKRILREVRLLRYLRGSPSIISLKGLVQAQDARASDTVWVALEYMAGRDMFHGLIRRHTPTSAATVRSYLEQILVGVLAERVEVVT